MPTAPSAQVTRMLSGLPGPVVRNSYSPPEVSTGPPLGSLSSSQGYYTSHRDFFKAGSHHTVFAGGEDRGSWRDKQMSTGFLLAVGNET